MSLLTSILTAGTNNHQSTSEEANLFATNFVTPGVTGNTSNTSGVAPMTGAFGMNCSGTDTNVTIATGAIVIATTPSGQGLQNLITRNTATITMAVSSNTSGSTVYDYYYVVHDATNANNPDTAGDNVASIVVHRSTSNVTDSIGAPANSQPIGMITLTSGFVNVTAGNIKDLRVVAGAAVPAGSIGNTQVAPGISSAKLSNPYEFRVYLASAQNTVNGFTRILFDTKAWDVGSNVDVVTNKGRFTATVSGKYHFNAATNIASGATFTSIALYKNGTLASQGSQHASGAVSSSEVVSDEVTLAVGDYVEVFVGAGAVVALTTGSTYSYFSGFLVSST